MPDPRTQARRLRRQAERLPDGLAKVSLLEEAIQFADQVNDLDLGYALRFELMSAAFDDRPDTMLVAFAWCLAQYDRHPDRFDRDDVLWKYTFVLTQAAGFPEIERCRLEQLLADMERRHRAAGLGLHQVHYWRRNLLMDLRDLTTARVAHTVFRRSRPNWWSHPHDHIAHYNLMYYSFQGQWRDAWRAGQSILATQPASEQLPYTLAEILFPLVRLRKIDEARQYQKRGYRLIARASHYVTSQAHHLRFAVLTGDLALAKRLVERHLAGALRYVLLDERFAFLQAARLWTACLRRRGTDRLKVRLPPGAPAPDAQGRCDVDQLGHWLADQAQDIAWRFDARNGNDWYQQQCDGLPALLRLAVE